MSLATLTNHDAGFSQRPTFDLRPEHGDKPAHAIRRTPPVADLRGLFSSSPSSTALTPPAIRIRKDSFEELSDVGNIVGWDKMQEDTISQQIPLSKGTQLREQYAQEMVTGVELYLLVERKDARINELEASTAIKDELLAEQSARIVELEAQIMKIKNVLGDDGATLSKRKRF